MATLAPILPPELEQVIFEQAAYLEPICVPTLMLVAWRVNHWVKHLHLRILMLYGGLTFEPQDLNVPRSKYSFPYPDDVHFSRIKAIPPTTLRNSVRHLYLDFIVPDLAWTLLPSCDAVQDLWISLHDHWQWNWEYSIVQIAGYLRSVRRLHCSVDELFSMEGPFDFGLPLFAQLTHVELFSTDIESEWAQTNATWWASIAKIPNLTHVAVKGQTLVRLAVIILRTSRTLRILVFLPEWDGQWAQYDLFEYYPEEARLMNKDTRFIQMDWYEYSQDWKAWAFGGMDFWARAEALIAGRNSTSPGPDAATD